MINSTILEAWVVYVPWISQELFLGFIDTELGIIWVGIASFVMMYFYAITGTWKEYIETDIYSKSWLDMEVLMEHDDIHGVDRLTSEAKVLDWKKCWEDLT